MPFQPVADIAADQEVLFAVIGRGKAITLSQEHDAFAWVAPEEAGRRSQAAIVGRCSVPGARPGP